MAAQLGLTVFGVDEVVKEAVQAYEKKEKIYIGNKKVVIPMPAHVDSFAYPFYYHLFFMSVCVLLL